MGTLLALMEEHRTALFWVSGVSAVMFVGSLLLIPVLIARAPEDFFVREGKRQRSPLALLLAIARNVLGAVLLCAGILMLVLPGQGLLMVLLGLSLLDVPGKRKAVRMIVQKPPVWRALSYFRQRAHKPPLQKP